MDSNTLREAWRQLIRRYKMKFKVGQRVQIRYEKPYEYGIVCHILDSGSIGVEHDKTRPRFHDCNGHCDEGYGYYYNSKVLQIATWREVLVQ